MSAKEQMTGHDGLAAAKIVNRVLVTTLNELWDDYLLSPSKTFDAWLRQKATRDELWRLFIALSDANNGGKTLEAAATPNVDGGEV